MDAVMSPELREKIRQRILKTLEHSPKSASDLRMVLGHSTTNLSAVLRELEAEGIIKREPVKVSVDRKRMSPWGPNNTARAYSLVHGGSCGKN